MIRMIDATELKTAFPSGEYVRTECVRATIDHMPIIAAIPMDWLDAQIRGYASALKSTELKALIVVKGLWEKDQEAR